MTISSVWDSIPHLSVAEMLANPEFLSDAVGERLDQFQTFETFFEKRNVGSDIVGYKHATATYLEDDDEYIPEGGEIPVSDPADEEDDRFVQIRKRGIGLRVTWEQIVDDKRDAVAEELIAKTNTVQRRKKLDALEALGKAPVQELAVTTPWDQDADVKNDLLDGQSLILGAKDDNGDPLQYTPAFVWANPVTVQNMLRSESMNKMYVGNMASENPLFKGLGSTPMLFSESIQVIRDWAIPNGEMWLGSSQKAGKMVQREDEYTSPFYAADGGAVDLRYGKRQTARSNYSHRRAFLVNHPLSVVKMTGLAS